MAAPRKFDAKKSNIHIQVFGTLKLSPRRPLQNNNGIIDFISNDLTSIFSYKGGAC